ncbi:MAG: hypothetical protein CM15mP21_1990 [Hyphomicrobiales bacterium]|nr:MAG: hypothetical protein CM15mP21_1990 [Hyphomicrobiales bacterium]
MLKELDHEIVVNSMRFKWRGVRAAFVQRLEADTLVARAGLDMAKQNGKKRRPGAPHSGLRKRKPMTAYQYVYVMDRLSKTYPGGKQVLKDIRLSFLPGVKIGIVGVNGAGKSTLLKIMAGLDKEVQGEAWAAEGARVGYLEQEPQLDPTKDVLGNVMEGVGEQKALVERYNELAMNYSDETADEMAALQDQIDAQNLWDLESQVEQAMDALRCPPSDASVENLSGGEKRRVALCKLLLEKPDLLLLDEPTNHLDAETVAWLQHHLADYAGTVVLVTHDRYFLDQITGWILELDRGQGIPYEGNYSDWLEQKQKRLAQEAREDEAKQRTLARELEWIRQSPKARQAKSKARVTAYEDLLASQDREDVGRAQITIPSGPRLGGIVLEAENLCKGFGDRLLIDNLSFRLPPGGIVGVIGPNGAGKTTLFKMLTGSETPDRVAGRGYGGDGLCRPKPRQSGGRQDRVGGNFRRAGYSGAWQAGNEFARLCRGFQFPWR